MPAVIGSNGVFGQLAANVFKVFPGNHVPPAGSSEDAGYHGGHTVFTYGSHITNGIDAVQMEFGIQYLGRHVLEKSARNAGATQSCVRQSNAWATGRTLWRDQIV